MNQTPSFWFFVVVVLFYFFKFYFIFKLYKIVLVLPNTWEFKLCLYVCSSKNGLRSICITEIVA